MKDRLWDARRTGNADQIESELRTFRRAVSLAKSALPLFAQAAFEDQALDKLDRIGGKLWDIKIKATPDKEIDWSEWRRAAAARQSMKSGRPKIDWNRVPSENLEPTDYPDGNWAFVGPKGLGNDSGANGFGSGMVLGRIGGIGVSSQNPNTTWYVGGANGGVFKTTNAGATWTEVSKGWSAIAIGDIVVDPTDEDVVYVGTGDPDDLNRLSMGMMKSINGGTTWQQLGESEFGTECVADILIDPDDNSTVYVAIADGSNSSSYGIWRSGNGGSTWNREVNLPCSGLSVSLPNNGGRFIWGSLTTSGLVRRFNNPLYSWSNVAYPATSKRVACSKINANTVYVADHSNKQFAKTTTNGANWNDIPTNIPVNTEDFWSQAWYDFTFDCFKTANNTDGLSIALVEHWVSRNAGTTFQFVSGYANGDTHVDYHRTTIHPTEVDKFFIGSDGGFYRMTYNPTFLHWDATNYNGTFGTGGNAGFFMFYSLATHPTAPSEFMGGTQDNGVPHARGSTSDWVLLHGADGTGTAISPISPNYQYSTTQYAGWSYNAQNQEIYKIRRSVDGSETQNVFEFPAFDGPPFVPVFHVSNDSLPKLYFGSKYLHRLDELSNGLAFATTKVGNFDYEDYITAISTSPSNPSIVYVGTASGRVYRSTNYGATNPVLLTDYQSYVYPVTCISVDPGNANSILITLAGAESATRDRVYRCTNTTAATPTFSSVGAGLPDIWTYWIERDPWRPTTVWYVANELGVFYTENSGGTWYDMSLKFGLPNVSVRQLSAEPATNRLYAATYGRGMFRLFISDTRPQLTSATYLNASVAGGDTTPLRVVFDQVIPPQGVTLNLVHSPPSAIQSPSSYFVPGGVSTIDIPVRAAVASSNINVTTTVTNPFGGSDSDSILVNNVRLSAFTLSQSTVTATYNVTGTLTLNLPAPAGGSNVALQSTLSSLVAVPPTVFIPAGGTTANFTIRTYGVFTSTTSADILANMGNSIWQTVNVNPITISSVSASPNPVLGGNAFTGTVTCSAIVGPNGLGVSLSDDSSSVVVPATMTIPTGFASGQFPGSTLGLQGPGNSIATITATQGIFWTRTTNLVVTPAQLASLTVPAKVNQMSRFPVTVAINTIAPAGGISVNLASSNPRAVWFAPTTLVVPAGESTATAYLGRAGFANQRATVTATLNASSFQDSVAVVRGR